MILSLNFDIAIFLNEHFEVSTLRCRFRFELQVDEGWEKQGNFGQSVDCIWLVESIQDFVGTLLQPLDFLFLCCVVLVTSHFIQLRDPLVGDEFGEKGLVITDYFARLNTNIFFILAGWN